MAFDVTLEMVQNGIAKVTLVGELDGSVAGQFRDKVQEAASQEAKRLILVLDKLEYMSSAGLRVLVFAKQKMGSGVDIYMVGAQEAVLEPIKMTGLDKSVILVDQYDAAILEAL